MVVMFHGVTKEDTTWFSPRHLPVDHFEKLIIYLKSNFNIVSLKDILSQKSKPSHSRKKNICITFDDGYVNNLSLALPILEKHKVSATFFISTLSTREDILSVLWADIVTLVAKNNSEFNFNGIDYKNSVNASGQHIFDVIKNMNAFDRDNALIEFAATYQVEKLLDKTPNEIWKLMSIDELKQFSASPMVHIGSHGHMHYNLGNINPSDAEKDMLFSKTKLETELGITITSIAYPDGSYSENVKKITENIGFTEQVAVHYNLDSDATDPRIINRHGISSTTTFHANIIHLCRAFNKAGF